jgi:hypothetical protein
MRNNLATAPPGSAAAAWVGHPKRRQGKIVERRRPHPYRTKHEAATFRSIGDVAAALVLKLEGRR